MEFHLPPAVPALATALAVGLLIGLERERRKRDDEHATDPAGIRTFALIALSGAIASLLGPVAIALAGGFVVLGALASYWRGGPGNLGLTTEVAMVATFLLGLLAKDDAPLAAGLAVGIAVILAAKSRLHQFANATLSSQEVRDGLLLAAAALIVLPLLPDTAPDPWGVLNLKRLWTLVVLVMAINAAGYVALRTFGSRVGLAIAGFTGGFVSSTATIASFGSRARQSPALRAECVAGAMMSNIATVIQLAIVVGALSMPLLRALAAPLAVTGGVALLAAFLSSFRSFRSKPHEEENLPGRAFEPKHALVFAAIVGAVMLLAAWLQSRFGDVGLTAAAAASGFADAHAAAASAAQVFAGGGVALRAAEFAVLAGFTTNCVSKLVVAATTGGAGYVVRLAPGIVAMAIAFAATVWFGVGLFAP